MLVLRKFGNLDILLSTVSDIHDLLVSLARRKVPGTDRWYSTPQHYVGSMGFCYCHICGYEFILYKKRYDTGYIFDSINEHGLKHLKESNLLSKRNNLR